MWAVALLISCALARDHMLVTPTNRTVRVPLTLVKGSNSLYANMYVGNPSQPITPTVYTDTFAITITSNAFKTPGYSCQTSKNCTNGISNLKNMTISFSLLPGVNDRRFAGETYIDMMCPQSDQTVCYALEKGIEFFTVES